VRGFLVLLVAASASAEEARVDGHDLVLTRTPRAGAPGDDAVLAERRGGELVPLWTGHLGAEDQDGERRAVLDLPSLTLYETRADVTLCDGQPARLDPRRIDLATGTLVPLDPGPTPPAPVVVATRAAPPHLGEATAPTVFRFEAATVGADDGAPRELDDGRRDTVWIGPGRGAVFIARGETRTRVVALRLVPGDARSTKAFRAADRPRRLVVRVGATPFVVEVPNDPTPQSYWAVLREPIPTSCVEVAVADVWGQRGRAAISELAVLTDVDAGGEAALAGMAREVAAGVAGAAASEHHLQLSGRPGVEALLAARRATTDAAGIARVRAALARIGDPLGAAEVAAGLAAAASPGEADLAAGGLTAMGDGAVPALAALLADDTAAAPARARAAQLLGNRGALAPLLAAAGRGPREVRQAVLVALAGRAGVDDLIPAAGDDPDRAADRFRAAGLAAGRATPEARARLAAAATAALAAGPGYELRYRLTQALAALGAPLPDEPEPALRQVAVEAMADPAAARRFVDDPDPGVRAAALARTDDRGAATARLERDAWPLVRRAAAEALAARCATAPLAPAARTDADETVRRAALAGLVRCKAPNAGAELIAVAGDETLSPGLRATAASLLGPLGDRQQVPALIDLMAGARTDAHTAPDIVGAEGAVRIAAAAAHTLGLLADPRAADGLRAAAEDADLPVLQATALAALGAICPPGARAVLEAGAHAEDALVVHAARAALRRCTR
jgi:hypothetical protein